VGSRWKQTADRPIVRVGTHREGNFVSRMKSHYVDDRKVERMSINNACPKDRSIFRKYIGRALLGRVKSAYLPVWNIDFQTKANKRLFGGQRNVGFERKIERAVTKVLREKFSFKSIPTGKHDAIIGGEGLGARLISTIAHCRLCKPSPDWLGRHSPVGGIRNGKLWLVQHLGSDGLNDKDWILCRAGSSTKAK
jgi:hypothetical protein